MSVDSFLAVGSHFISTDNHNQPFITTNTFEIRKWKMINCLIFKTQIIQQVDETLDLVILRSSNYLQNINLNNIYINNLDYQSIFSFKTSKLSLDIANASLDYIRFQNYQNASQKAYSIVVKQKIGDYVYYDYKY